MKENVVVGRLIPAGTGLTYHETRRLRAEAKRNAELDSDSVSASEVEAAFSEALKSEVESASVEGAEE